MFQGETEEVKLSIEKSCCCVKRARKRSWSDRTRQVETVHITSGSRLQARLEETAADVVYFQEHRWSAPRLPEQRSRIRKNGWDLTQSPPVQSERSESAASGGAVMNRTVLFLNTMTQVLLAIDLPLKVDGVFNLAGEVLQQSGWLHAVRARIAAPSSDTPMCLDSTGKGKVIDFFVVSEELHLC